jgi:hypothetical protein
MQSYVKVIDEIKGLLKMEEHIKTVAIPAIHADLHALRAISYLHTKKDVIATKMKLREKEIPTLHERLRYIPWQIECLNDDIVSTIQNLRQSACGECT